jgi:hypothetical protein
MIPNAPLVDDPIQALTVDGTGVNQNAHSIEREGFRGLPLV